MSDINKVTAVEKAELGYLEKKSNACLDDKTANAGKANYTKYWRDIRPSFQGQAWCAAFQVWCFIKAFGDAEARKLLLMECGYSFYTPTIAKAFYDKGQYDKNPKVGDLIFFRSDASAKEGRWHGIHHIGYVYKVSSTTVYTYEGNTSAGTQVIPNGGGVCAKSYALTDCAIDGYAHPRYTCEAVQSGWKQDGEDWYYYKNGKMVKGDWVHHTDCYWYYLSAKDGKMLKGWRKLYDSNNVLRDCYFDDSGRVWWGGKDNCGYLEPYYDPKF